MITISEVSPEVKSRVVALMDRDVTRGVLDPDTLRTVVTGLALQTLNKKYNGALGDGIKTNASDLISDAQTLELIAERTDKLRDYLQLARDIYVEATLADVEKAFGPEIGKLATSVLNAKAGITSAPDATGNSLDVEAAADSICPICNTVHEN